MTRIIDLRNRPSFLQPFYGSGAPGEPEYETVRWLSRRTGAKDDQHFARSRTPDAYLAELRAAGISAAVVVGRETPDLTVSNDAVFELVSGRDELLGLGSVDAQARGPDATAAEIERAIHTLGFKGINLEPGFGKPPLQFDDPILYPAYEVCASLGVPVFVMSGPTSPSLQFTDPTSLGRAAAAFKQLQFVAYHGFWPYVNEIIGVAFRHDNVFVVPDMYLFLPGGSLYVEAGNGFLQDQLLFATSYPFRPMKQTVEDFIALGWRETVLDKVLYRNAEAVLGLVA